MDNQWDDNLIIDAYEKSMASVNRTVNNMMLSDKDENKNQKENSIKITKDSNQLNIGQANKEANKEVNNKKKWKVGDYCQAIYEEDNNLYEAEILKIIENKHCIIKYLGYLNEENKRLDELKESAGEVNRKNQELKYLEETLSDNSSLNDDADEINDFLSNQHQQTSKSSNKSTTKSIAAVLVPPPPFNLASSSNRIDDENELFASTLMSWYMSGYHTGYYQAIQDLKKSKS